MSNRALIESLRENRELPSQDYKTLLSTITQEERLYLAKMAREVTDRVYGKEIYLRGIIEFTNYCKNDCYYCGLRKSNDSVIRYRMTEKEILAACKMGYAIGMRTFVLQGGEDPTYDKGLLTHIIHTIKSHYPDCAITLSVGEKSKELYQEWFDAGADRFLLRHETATESHYEKLHPSCQTLANRMRCLRDLKDIGYQVGAGIMVGSPYQTIDTIVTDLQFMSDFSPEMIGIGPFIPHEKTPFKNEPIGSFDLTLTILSLVRLIHPHVLLPATTAMDTVRKNGRLEAIQAGCNVIMPNITPPRQRENYKLYNDMAELRSTHSIGIHEINDLLSSSGYQGVTSRGDYKKEIEV